MKLLIVCFGNRSKGPMATGLARKIAAAHRLALEIQTAEATGRDTAPVSPLAVDAMRQLSVDISQDCPKPISHRLVEWADLVLAIEPGLALGLALQYPEKADHILCLGEEVAEPHRPVATLGDYVQCRDLLEKLLREMPIWCLPDDTPTRDTPEPVRADRGITHGPRQVTRPAPTFRRSARC
jgi:protein-tyrosine-phosphatase